MDSQKYLHVCRSYERQWDQLCANSHGSHIHSNKNDKLLCSLMQRIIVDCKQFHIKKMVKKNENSHIEKYVNE